MIKSYASKWDKNVTTRDKNAKKKKVEISPIWGQSPFGRWPQNPVWVRPPAESSKRGLSPNGRNLLRNDEWRAMSIQNLSYMVPEMKELLKRRMLLLQSIQDSGNAGRRTLVKRTGLGERTIRNDLEVFAQEGLAESHAGGVRVTEKGIRLLGALRDELREFLRFGELEASLQEALGIPVVTLLPGNADQQGATKSALGRMGAEVLHRIRDDYPSIAVAGGSTLAELALHVIPVRKPNLLILPARGGLGEEMELQANTIAARIAGGMEAQYRLLHLPDALTGDLAEALLHNPQIAAVIHLIRSSQALFLSVSSIEELIRRGQLEDSEIQEVRRKGGVAEALGYFFNPQGEVVYSKSSIGIKIEDLEKKLVVLIAGGHNKARAIEAVAKRGFIDILITDEGAAEGIAANKK